MRKEVIKMHHPQRISAAKYFGDEDDEMARICYAAAEKNGLTPEEAETCDDGNRKCPECPFLKKE